MFSFPSFEKKRRVYKHWYIFKKAERWMQYHIMCLYCECYSCVYFVSNTADERQCTHVLVTKASTERKAFRFNKNMFVVYAYIHIYGLNWRYLPFMSLEPNCVLKNLLKKLSEFRANDSNKIMRHSSLNERGINERTHEWTTKTTTNEDHNIHCLFLSPWWSFSSQANSLNRMYFYAGRKLFHVSSKRKFTKFSHTQTMRRMTI